VKANKRERWKSLKTKLPSVAKLRLAEFEKTSVETIEITGAQAGTFPTTAAWREAKIL